MSYPTPRMLTTPSRKRKEREVFYPATLAKPVPPQTAVKRAVSGTNSATTSFKGSQPKQQQPLSSNRLLAGYMAHEFLTNGTLFGQKFDPARAEAVPVSSAEWKRNRPSQMEAIPEAVEPPRGKLTPHSYVEVAHVLKSDGAHIAGVVNPTQLANWIQM